MDSDPSSITRYLSGDPVIGIQHDVFIGGSDKMTRFSLATKLVSKKNLLFWEQLGANKSAVVSKIVPKSGPALTAEWPDNVINHALAHA